jgi:DNA-binding NarL/FixJ family response regulator
MNELTRLVIADDHPLYREGLVRALERDPSFMVVGQATNGEEALKQIAELRPDLVVLDISMPVLDGIEVAQRVHQEGLPVEMVILTMYKEPRYFNVAFDLGVRGYIVKDSGASEILSCLKMVTAGEYYISPSISSLLMERNKRIESFDRSVPIHERLTPAELKVLRLVGENRTSKEIAEMLFVSVRTIENHRMHICQKLDIKGHNKLLQFVLENKALF